MNPERDQIYPEVIPEVETPEENPRPIPKPRLSKRPIPAPHLRNKVKEPTCQQINPTPMSDTPAHENKVKDTDLGSEVKQLDIRLVRNLQNPELETKVETTIRPPDPYSYREKECMSNHINDEDIIRKHIPKQIELDKWIEKIKRKVIHDYDVPITVKEMAAEYSTSPKYRDIYNYLNKGFIPSQYKGTSLQTLKMKSEDYVIIKGVLFRLTYKSKKEGVRLRLVVPEKLVPLILYQYHDTLAGGHYGIQVTFPTINEKYYIEDLFPLLGQYILACHVCQSRRPAGEYAQAHYARYPVDYNPLTRLNADLK